MSKYQCINCGHKDDRDKKYCPHCGMGFVAPKVRETAEALMREHQEEFVRAIEKRMENRIPEPMTSPPKSVIDDEVSFYGLAILAIVIMSAFVIISGIVDITAKGCLP